MRLKLICCSVFEEEVQSAIVRSRNRIDVHYVEHNGHPTLPENGLAEVQRRVDEAAHSQYQAVLLLAGKCKALFRGVTARTIPLVLPRTQDCLNLLLGRPGAAARPDPSVPAPAQFRAGCRTTPLRVPHLGLALNPWPTRCWNQGALRQHRTRCERRVDLGAPVNGLGTDRQEDQLPSDRGSILQMMLEGYWNYSDFLVVPPGWRVVVNLPTGTIAAEEVTS